MLRAVGEFILVLPDEFEEMSDGGIAIPETAQIIPTTGEVVSANDSPDCPVKVGDHVIFPKYKGTVYKTEFGKLKFLKNEDIMGVEEGDGE